MPDPAPAPKVACTQVFGNKPLIQEASQTRTKAKARYLKAKKERRKKRKVLSVPHVALKPDTSVQRPPNSSEDDSSDGETASEEQRTIHSQALAGPETEVTKRPKKRRKNQIGSGDETMDIYQAPAPERGPRPDTEQEEVAPLRSFPVPKQPEPPSKSVLARQGLDRSLANAEVIDPTSTLPLQEENHITRRLSARMRKRLLELGITDLFASKPWCTSPSGYSPTVITSSDGYPPVPSHQYEHGIRHL
jgi:ATP-dependent RNA helicase DDX51/DBP6